MQRSLSLDAIGVKFGTDKASPLHNYLRFYEEFFASLRDAPVRVLEIGVATGASVRTWEEYFPNGTIVGVDITPEAKTHEVGRVIVEIADQSNIEELTRLGIKHGPFDIIIEDGSHMWDHQITSLRALFPFLKHDGFYVVEDLQTNYGKMQKEFKGVASTSCMEYLKTLTDLRVADDQIPIDEVEDAFLRTYGRSIQYITFYRRACLIKKNYRPSTPRLPVIKVNKGPLLFSGDERSVRAPVRLTAHVGFEGDVIGEAGLINPGIGDHTIQGVSMSSATDAIEYRVRLSDGSWTFWAQSGVFLGTRGIAKALTGIGVRVKPDVRSRFSVRIFGRFTGLPEIVEAQDAEEGITGSGRALAAFQIDLVERP